MAGPVGRAEVLGVGFGRTGTKSLQEALQILGYPCYHMFELMARKEHLERWAAHARGEAPPPLGTVFESFSASVDFPVCTYYEEVQREHPDVKVVLTTRDPERWYKSWLALETFMAGLPMRAFAAVFHPTRMILQVHRGTILERVFKGDLSKGNVLATMERHNEAVRERVPKGQLLEFQVTQGWGPLCEFLGKEVPDVPFPHSNEGDGEFWKRFRTGVWEFAAPLVGASLAVVAFVLAKRHGYVV